MSYLLACRRGASYSVSDMADLQLAPARGRTSLVAIAIALLVLAAIAWAVFLLNPRRTAELTVTSVKTFAPHTTFKDLPTETKGMHVLDQTPESEDNLYVVATVRLADKLRLPLYLSGWNAELTDKDGSVIEATAVPARDLERLTDIFPALAPMLKAPLHDGDQVLPGAAREGTVVLLFPGVAQEAWTSRKLARLTLNLRNQAPQVVVLP